MHHNIIINDNNKIMSSIFLLINSRWELKWSINQFLLLELKLLKNKSYEI